jgi:dihydropyrimidinase
MSPPIRSAEDGAALRRALAGGALQVVATDHAVFNSTQKAVGRRDFRLIPNGVNGIEERMHVVWEEMVNSGAGGLWIGLHREGAAGGARFGPWG